MPRPHDVSRRSLLRTAAIGSMALATGIDEVFGQTARPPNIVFIMADDSAMPTLVLRPAGLEHSEHRPASPRKGVRSSAYANSAVCTATRTAMITGRYQYRFGSGSRSHWPEPATGLPPEHPTLPSLLKKAGYGRR